MSLLGIAALLSTVGVQPSAAYALHAKPLELALLTNEYCEYGLTRPPPYKWCICWGRIDVRGIEVLPWDCYTRSPKFKSRKKRDKKPGWKLENILQGVNTRKNLFPKDLLKDDRKLKIQPSKWRGQKPLNESALGEVFSIMFGEMAKSKGSRLLMNATNSVFSQYKFNHDLWSKIHKQQQAKQSELMEKALTVMFKEIVESGDDSLLADELKYLLVPVFNLYFASINPTSATLFSRLASTLKTFLNRLEDARSTNELKEQLILDATALGSKILIAKNAMIADLEGLLKVLKEFPRTQIETTRNFPQDSNFVSHTSNNEADQISAELEQNPGIPKPKSEPIPAYRRNMQPSVQSGQILLNMLLAAKNLLDKSSVKVDTVDVNIGNASAEIELADSDVVLTNGNSSQVSSEPDVLANLIKKLTDGLRKSLNLNQGMLRISKNDPEVAETVGNALAKVGMVEESPKNDSLVKTVVIPNSEIDSPAGESRNEGISANLTHLKAYGNSDSGNNVANISTTKIDRSPQPNSSESPRHKPFSDVRTSSENVTFNKSISENFLIDSSENQTYRPKLEGVIIGSKS